MRTLVCCIVRFGVGKEGERRGPIGCARRSITRQPQQLAAKEAISTAADDDDPATGKREHPNTPMSSGRPTKMRPLSDSRRTRFDPQFGRWTLELLRKNSKTLAECSKMVNKGREWCNVLLPAKKTTANYRHAKTVFYEAPVTGNSWTFWPTNEPVGRGLNLNSIYLFFLQINFMKLRCVKCRMIRITLRPGKKTGPTQRTWRWPNVSAVGQANWGESAAGFILFIFFSLNYCSVGSCELLAAGSASK